MAECIVTTMVPSSPQFEDDEDKKEDEDDVPTSDNNSGGVDATAFVAVPPVGTSPPTYRTLCPRLPKNLRKMRMRKTTRFSLPQMLAEKLTMSSPTRKILAMTRVVLCLRPVKL